MKREWFGRILQMRFASRGRALWAFLATWVSFFLVSWLLFEALHPSHRFHAPLIRHLRAFPDELLVQLLLSPIMMPFAIPALFHRGNLFQWDPGGLEPIFFLVYWALLGVASIALVRSRRMVWWFLVMLILLATAPRLGELIYVALLAT